MTHIVETLRHFWTRFIWKDEVGLAELVEWSYRPESDFSDDNPEYVSFAERYNRSRIRRLMEPYTRPAARGETARTP